MAVLRARRFDQGRLQGKLPASGGQRCVSEAAATESEPEDRRFPLGWQLAFMPSRNARRDRPLGIYARALKKYPQADPRWFLRTSAMTPSVEPCE